MCKFSLHVYICTTCMSRSQKRVSYSLELFIDDYKPPYEMLAQLNLNAMQEKQVSSNSF